MPDWRPPPPARRDAPPPISHFLVPASASEPRATRLSQRVRNFSAASGRPGLPAVAILARRPAPPRTAGRHRPDRRTHVPEGPSPHTPANHGTWSKQGHHHRQPRRRPRAPVHRIRHGRLQLLGRHDRDVQGPRRQTWSRTPSGTGSWPGPGSPRSAASTSRRAVRSTSRARSRRGPGRTRTATRSTRPRSRPREMQMLGSRDGAGGGDDVDYDQSPRPQRQSGGGDRSQGGGQQGGGRPQQQRQTAPADERRRRLLVRPGRRPAVLAENTGQLSP